MSTSYRLHLLTRFTRAVEQPSHRYDTFDASLRYRRFRYSTA